MNSRLISCTLGGIEESIPIQQLKTYLDNNDYAGLHSLVADNRRSMPNIEVSNLDNFESSDSNDYSEDHDGNQQTEGVNSERNIDNASVETNRNILDQFEEDSEEEQSEQNHNIEESKAVGAGFDESSFQSPQPSNLSNQYTNAEVIERVDNNRLRQRHRTTRVLNRDSRLHRSVTPHRINFDNSLEQPQPVANRYTMGHAVEQEIEEIEEDEESESERSATTIRFERTISVSIEAPNAELLTQEQFSRLEQIFDDAFDFNRFMRNFLDNFPRMEELLRRELSNLNLNERTRAITPSAESISQLPEVEISRRH